MNKQFTRLIVGLVVLLLGGVCFISSTSSNASFRSLNSAIKSVRILYVGNASDPSQNGVSSQTFPSIQAAINASNPGDTVSVPHGHYNENITISQSINLVGESKDNTIIDGSSQSVGAGVVVNIKDVSNVNISGFGITDAYNAPRRGIAVSNASRVNIFGNMIFRGNGYGVYVDSSNITITNNEIDGNDNGIYATSSNTTITNNTILYNAWGVTLDCTDSKANVSSIISNNTVSAVNPGSEPFGIRLLSCNYADVNRNNVTNVDTGIYVYQGMFENISGNIENTVLSGILLEGCYDSTFVNNTIHGRGKTQLYTNGISLVTGSSLHPLGNSPVQSNTFSNNTVEDIYYGIGMDANAYQTARATGNVLDNIVVGNTFRGCGFGVYMENTSSNYVYHNNFFDNGAYYDGDFTDNWSRDYPIGGNYWGEGNYWSDTQWGENQTKQGSDMFIDKPYTGGGGTVTDPYPLLKQWPMPGFCCPKGFDLAILTSPSNATKTNNATITYFGFDIKAGISFNVTDKTSGSCAVIIPKTLMDGAFNVSLDNVPAVCYFDWSDQYHMMNFTYGPGSHYVKISAEVMEKSTNRGDTNGDGKVDLRDLQNVAARYGHAIQIQSPMYYTGTALHVTVKNNGSGANVAITLSKIYVNGVPDSGAIFIPALLQKDQTSTVTTNLPSDFNPSDVLDVKVVCSDDTYTEVNQTALALGS